MYVIFSPQAPFGADGPIDFFSYVAYIGSFVSCMLFQGPALWRSYKQQWQGGRVHNDKLTQLARQYPQVPLWWNLALFG